MPDGWSEKPAKLAQKDRDARWTVKWSKAKPAEDGSPRVDLAVPVFGYKNHLGIDRRHGLICTWAVTDAARYEGALLPGLVDKTNTARDVWADTAYRSKANERHLADNGLRSRIHRKKPNRRIDQGIAPERIGNARTAAHEVADGLVRVNSALVAQSELRLWSITSICRLCKSGISPGCGTRRSAASLHGSACPAFSMQGWNLFPDCTISDRGALLSRRSRRRSGHPTP